MLSMIQHGPYDASHEPAYGLDRSALNRPTTGRLSDWLSRMETLNRDVMDFDQALQATGLDLILTYFGDHQPNLEGEVPLTGKLDQPRFLTRFAIKGSGRHIAERRDGAGPRHPFPGFAAARARRNSR